jgi:hypothetical protein
LGYRKGRFGGREGGLIGFRQEGLLCEEGALGGRKGVMGGREVGLSGIGEGWVGWGGLKGRE